MRIVCCFSMTGVPLIERWMELDSCFGWQMNLPPPWFCSLLIIFIHSFVASFVTSWRHKWPSKPDVMKRAGRTTGCLAKSVRKKGRTASEKLRIPQPTLVFRIVWQCDISQPPPPPQQQQRWSEEEELLLRARSEKRVSPNKREGTWWWWWW